MTDAWLEELSLEECLGYLRENVVGRIAVVINDFPVVLPVNYRLVETSRVPWIALRTRPGSVIARAPMHAGFEIDGVDRAQRRGWSVLARGTLHHVDPDADNFRAQFDPEPWTPSDPDSWLVIQPFAITGRRLHSGSEEWSFHLDRH